MAANKPKHVQNILPQCPENKHGGKIPSQIGIILFIFLLFYELTFEKRGKNIIQEERIIFLYLFTHTSNRIQMACY